MVEPRGEVSLCAGRQLHWRERPGEGPTVVLMSGCGLAMEFWRDLRRLLDGRRVLSYDRPGMGGTAWPRRMPTLDEEVESLAALLRQRDAGQCVLVAHSMAAFHAEALARVYPQLVRAVVLVDPSDEWWASAPSVSGPGLARFIERTVRLVRLGRPASAAFRFGTYLQSYWTWQRFGHGRLTAVYRDQDALAMAMAESMAYDAQAWRLLQLRRQYPWPGVPTVVLTAEEAGGADEVASHGRLARLLGGRQWVVPGSKHLMMLDRPEVIARAIGAVGD